MSQNKKLKYICIETSMRHGFVSICENDSVKDYSSWVEDKHSNKITDSLSMISDFVKKDECQFIALDLGPGRFTGVRIGVSFAKVLAYHIKKPIFPCSSLRLLVEPYLNQKEAVLSIIQAYGNQFYVGGYKKQNDNVQCIIPPQSIFLDELEKKIQQPFICIGDVYQKNEDISSSHLKQFLNVVPFQPINKDGFCSTVLSEWDSSQCQNWEEVEPTYLRTPGVVQNK